MPVVNQTYMNSNFFCKVAYTRYTIPLIDKQMDFSSVFQLPSLATPLVKINYAYKIFGGIYNQ
jgi:hypothetical protein